MKLFLVHRPTVRASVCPYRLLDEHDQEIAWANAFLDGQCIRQLSLRSLRAYAYDLLHFARWWSERPLPQPLSEISESTLLDYVRHQLDQEPKPTPQTVNHRLCVVHCLYRFHYGREVPAGQSHFQRIYTRRCPLSYGRPRRALAVGLRLRQPQRVIVPLTAEEVAKFWGGFRTFRDLALVGLMLLDGLRSCEILSLQLEDLQLANRQIRILGKGNKQRVLPLTDEIVGGAAELSEARKTSDQLVGAVRVAEGPQARKADELRWTSFAVSSPSVAQPDFQGQPTQASAHVRSRYGASRNLPARSSAPDGAFPDSHHHALRPPRRPRRMARICSSRPEPCALLYSVDPMSQAKLAFNQIFEAHIQNLGLSLRPKTVANYRGVVRSFLGYLEAAFPQLRRLSQLRRDPHMLGWFRSLREQDPPLCNETRRGYLHRLRRLLDDLAANGHRIQPDLIDSEDFPPPEY